MKLPASYKISTHENAIEMLLTIAEQALNRETLIKKTSPNNAFMDTTDTNIETLKKAIEYGHDYLMSDSYPHPGVKPITDRYKRDE